MLVRRDALVVLVVMMMMVRTALYNAQTGGKNMLPVVNGSFI